LAYDYIVLPIFISLPDKPNKMVTLN